MKLTISPQNILERIALLLNLAPTPLVDTQIAYTSARAIMAAADTGLFQALGKTPKTLAEIAQSCQTNPPATKQLLDCLVGLGYLSWKNDQYALKKRYHKWLLPDSPHNLLGKLRFQLTEWNWMNGLENFVRTGQPLHFHQHMTPGEWALYQLGMRDLSYSAAQELAKKIKLPASASHMLDIGGAHGLYSVNLCRRYPNLRSTILELPGAIDQASAIAAKEGLADRISHQPGNALTDDLGENLYDLILINNVVHHFTREENVMLARKAAKALKPGGLYAIGEFIRPPRPTLGDAVSTVSGLYFALTSSSGTWSLEDIQSWQKQAGFQTGKTISLLTLPGWKLVVGVI